jgi:hypothetical protein
VNCPSIRLKSRNAIETWSELWFNDDYVYGGRSSIVSTFFGDAPTPMFERPAPLLAARQGNFITSFFPEGTEAGVDYDFFYLPPVDEAYGRPFLVAGDMIAMFNDRPEVRALMEYFTTPQSVSGWLEGGGAIAAHQTATRTCTALTWITGFALLVADATSFRFDGSDLMPGEVGSGSFWNKSPATSAARSIDLDTAWQEIDASWPAEGVSGQAPPGNQHQRPWPCRYARWRSWRGPWPVISAGTTVTVDGPSPTPTTWREVQRIHEPAFEEATGITVNYIGDKEFEGSHHHSVDAGDAPDIADFPQPGLFANLRPQGAVVTPPPSSPMNGCEQQYNQSWLDINTVPGRTG